MGSGRHPPVKGRSPGCNGLAAGKLRPASPNALRTAGWARARPHHVLGDMWELALQTTEAAFDTADDQHQALLSHVSTKLLADAQQGRMLASDLSRVISDYLRAPASGRKGTGTPQPIRLIARWLRRCRIAL